MIESDNVLVMNGDSYSDVDLCNFVVDHRRANADLSAVVVAADGRGDCGSVLLDGNGKILGFTEKQDPFHAPYVNAGIYLMSRQMLYEIPPGREVSLERELLPQWLRQGKYIKGFVFSGRCVDIGTPERYRSAQDMLANVEVDTSTTQHEGQL
jgi:NDP-sugar pyrophosphorylase family protein